MIKKLFITTLGLAFVSSSLFANETELMNPSQAKIRLKTLIEQIKKESNKETHEYLDELVDATSVILDNTKQPIGAFGFMGGIDIGGQIKVPYLKAGDKNLLLGPGFQAIFGPLFTLYKDEKNKLQLQHNTSSLIGFNVTGKVSKDPLDLGFQGQMGIVIVIPHTKKDGVSKNKRVLDLGGNYFGVAGEGAIPVFLLNRIRLNVGVYTKPDASAFVSESGGNPFKRQGTVAFETVAEKGSAALSSVGKSLSSFIDNIVIGDSTLVVINAQAGTKDAPVEIQAEGLHLKVTP